MEKRSFTLFIPLESVGDMREAVKLLKKNHVGKKPDWNAAQLESICENICERNGSGNFRAVPVEKCTAKKTVISDIEYEFGRKMLIIQLSSKAPGFFSGGKELKNFYSEFNSYLYRLAAKAEKDSRREKACLEMILSFKSVRSIGCVSAFDIFRRFKAYERAVETFSDKVVLRDRPERGHFAAEIPTSHTNLTDGPELVTELPGRKADIVFTLPGQLEKEDIIRQCGFAERLSPGLSDIINIYVCPENALRMASVFAKNYVCRRDGQTVPDWYGLPKELKTADTSFAALLIEKTAAARCFSEICLKTALFDEREAFEKAVCALTCDFMSRTESGSFIYSFLKSGGTSVEPAGISGDPVEIIGDHYE